MHLLRLLVVVFFSFNFASALSDPVESVLDARELASKNMVEDAIEVAGDALPNVKEVYGADHPYYVYTLDDLSRYHQLDGEPEKALRYSEIAVGIAGRLSSLPLTDRLDAEHNYGSALSGLGHIAEAIEVFENVLAGRVSIGDTGAEQEVLQVLGKLMIEDRQYDRAIVLLQRSQTAAKTLRGTGSRRFIEVSIDLSNAYLLAENAESAQQILQGISVNTAEEQPIDLEIKLKLMKSRLAIYQTDLLSANDLLAGARAHVQSDSVDRALAGSVYYNMARMELLRGNALEAESYYKQAIAEYSKTTGLSHPSVLRSMQGLALSLKFIGDYAAAADIFEEIVQVLEERFGKSHLQVAEALAEWVHVQIDLGRTDIALQMARRADEIIQASENATVFNKAVSTAALGFSFAANGMEKESIKYLNSAIGQFIDVRGAHSADLLPGYLKLTELYLNTNQVGLALGTIDLASSIITAGEAGSPSKGGQLLYLKSKASRVSGECGKAIEFAVSGLELVSDYIALSTAKIDISKSSLDEDRAVVENIIVEMLECVNKSASANGLVEEILKGVQLPQLQTTAAAISRLDEQDISFGSFLNGLLKKRKGNSIKIKILEEKIEDQVLFEKNKKEIQDLVRRRDRLVVQTQKLNDEIAAADSRYGEYLIPRPESLPNIQKSLRSSEGLLSILILEKLSVSFLITKNNLYLEKVMLGRKEISEMVASIRSTVDFLEVTKEFSTLEFDTNNAYRLYQSLISPFGDILEEIEHLTIVADGALQRIPFSVFLTEAFLGQIEKQSDLMRLEYLVKKHSLSYLPSIGSLSVLRGLKKGIVQKNSRFVGFGDPVVNVVDSLDVADGVKRSAEDNIQIHPDLLDGLFERLPESVAELKSLAENYPDGSADVYLGKDATKERVLASDLRNIDILAFATHGIMANELAPLFTEPGLLMSVSETANPEADLFLTASEIATLDIDADMVLLSACNTAAPASDEIGAEGLSGLARSFFYAGARSLFVSHWYVDSRSAQLLTTGMLENTNKQVSGRKSVGLQNISLDFINGEFGRWRAHPAFWAPFVLVGVDQAIGG